MTSTTTTTESKALTLLGYGATQEQVAAACGVEPSRITQLISDSHFMAQVAELRFQNLSRHNARDTKLDTLEDMLIEKLDTLKEFMIRPMEVLKALQVINQCKRRGTSSPEMIGNQQSVVTLIMPIAVTQRFTTNINNQVVVAGNQELTTIPSATLLDSVKEKMKASIPNGFITSNSKQLEFAGSGAGD